jgi:hypothetical protein
MSRTSACPNAQEKYWRKMGRRTTPRDWKGMRIPAGSEPAVQAGLPETVVDRFGELVVAVGLSLEMPGQ